MNDYSQFAIILVVLLYLIVFYFVFMKSERKKRIRKFHFKGLASTFSSNKGVQNNIEEFELVNKKLNEKFPKETKRFRNSLEVLEDVFAHLSVIDIERIAKVYRLKNDEIENIQRDKILKMIEHIKNDRPFSTIKSKEEHLLMNIKTALDTNSVELGNTMLLQLSNNIEILESDLYNQKKQTEKSFIVAIIGVILTVLFGINQLFNFIADLFR